MDVDEKYGSISKSAAGTSPQRLPRFRLNDPSGEVSNPAPTPSPSHAGGIASSSSQNEQLTSPRGSTFVSQPPLQGSVLGKRRASLMEEPKFLSYQDARPATSLSGHSRLGAKAQATEAAISSVFRRESMISPVDLAPLQNRFNLSPSCPQRLPSSLGLQSSYMPSPDAQGYSGIVSPTHRETQAPSLSISAQKVQDVDVGGMEVDHSELQEHRPSLPGFKSLFGLDLYLAEERPIVSRNSSSGFPDLETLKAPLSLALAPYSGTRSSNDSGTTSIWSSSRSSLGARESISTTTTTGSVGLTPSSVTSYSSFPFKPQSPGSAGSVRPRQRYQSDSGSHRIGSSSNRGSISQVGIDQDMIGGNVERTGSLLLDLAKRPSYVSFNAEVEKQRTEIQRQRSMAQAEEAWRRQSDNAAVMSEERKRLLGNSPQPLPHRGFGKSVEAPLQLASQSSANENDSHPDEAIRAARTRLLRYESYPFGSKDAENEVLGMINPANVTDIHRRQSMFPHRANNEIGPSDMSNLSERSELVHIAPNSNFSVNPGWQEAYEQQHPPSTSSQRDIQFEEIVRKASVDLAKRSTTSSLTGTPILGARALVLPIPTMESANRASPMPPILHTRISDGAEVANSREREQHQHSIVHTSAPTSAAASRSTTPRRVSSPLHSRDGAFASTSMSGHAPHQETHSPSRHGVQESQPQWGHTDEYRRSSFQVPSETSRPALLERSQPQRHSIPMDIDQRQMNLQRRSTPPKDLGPLSGSYARPSTRLDKPFNSPIPWHTAYGAPDIDVTRSGEGSRRESLSRVAAGKHNTVIPYYDNPEPPPVYGANNTLEFPSVLRNDYPLGSNSHPPKVGGPSNILVHDSATHVRPGPNQIALQQQGAPAAVHSLYHTWNPDSRRDSYTSLPPGPARTMTAPNVGSSTTLPGPRYTCDHCGKSFSRPSSLKIHIYSHTGEKPYKCTWPDCTRSFSVQSNLKRHAKVHLENGGQQGIASGTDHPNTELGSGHAAAAFPGGSHGTNTPGGPSSGYSTGFLTPQTVQPLPANHKPEGYFDVRNIHAGPHASHSPAPGGLPKSHPGSAHPPSTAMQGYLASPSNAGNAGPRIPSLLHYSTQGPLTRRESGSGAYGGSSDPR
ncbi:hypothetical protein QFC22_006679 [Naganishia vaughanmartiniae]|uniref:Uncharacterized protein n=1 Tax=Naganishia vaughanmartiniae TaxID=1424756 RepID=A0ACC2WJU2_9TREE|nr:hypothetical protein QFC22_006679 [Naganishia vaughanmartiniae]